MKLLILILVFFYTVIAQRLFSIWLKFFQRDSNMSPGEKQLSWVVLIVGTVLWPVVIPNAYLAILEKKLES
ncbi:hypothetical protein [Allocoleopsis sp.]|uniref:hypothetical protein n=1 Tax=Allocoleopsis sp. TaxID=3088169 RepID=UPI002FD1A606